MSDAPLDRLKYLTGYPPDVLARVREALDAGTLGESLARRHPERHDIRTDAALYAYVTALRQRFMRNAEPVTKVMYDSKLHVVRHALGTHTMVSRVQGGRLKAKREIRIASVFREAPAAMLRLLVVHELAHLKERDHDRAFYALCMHMEPDYHQLEFDVRLWLTAREIEGSDGAAPAG